MLLDGFIKLPKLKLVNMKQHREIPSHHIIKSCTISRTKTGKYYVSILALNFSKSVADHAWGMFTTFFQYKLEEQGKKLIKIDKWFPSSKTCSCYGRKKNLYPSLSVHSAVNVVF